MLVGLLLALGRLFDMNRKLEEARLAEAAAGAAAGEAPAEAAGAKKRLQRATPVVVIQPDREVRWVMHILNILCKYLDIMLGADSDGQF